MKPTEGSELIHKCFICRSPSLNGLTVSGQPEYHVDCTRCGNYHILRRTTLLLKGKEYSDVQRANMSGFVRQSQGILIQDGDVEFLESLRTPTVGEKAVKLLLQIVQEFPSPGESFVISYEGLDPLLKVIEDNTEEEYLSDPAFTESCRTELYWLAVSWAKDGCELEFLLRDYLNDERGILGSDKVNGLVITPQGWDFLDSLKTSEAKSQSGFVAMWFDPSVHPAFLQAIGPGIEDAGYEAIRIDNIERQLGLVEKPLRG